MVIVSKNNLKEWTLVLLFFQMNSHPIVQGSQASQPSGYVGCYPDAIAKFIGNSSTHLNDGVYCIGVCRLDGYRFAATQNHTCKCANVTTYNVYADEAKCDFSCPGNEQERCGGNNGVSLYDTMQCAHDKNGLSVLTRDGNQPPQIQYHADNSPTSCASYCKENRYIISGTKKNMCICGDNIKIGYKTSTKCDAECPRNTNETCGGEDSVSLRRTGYVKPTTEISKSTKPQTTTKIHVTPKTGNTVNSGKGSKMIALYITLPVVTIVVGSVILTVGLIFRHRRKKKKANVNRLSTPSSKYEPGSERNEILDNHNLQAQGVAITTQTIQADDRCYDEYNQYSTVLDSKDTLDNNKDYDKINGKPATSTRAIYSHLPKTGTTDNTYSHIGPASRTNMIKTDNTYNTIQFSQLTENTNAPSYTNDDKNAVYDRAATRDKRQLNVMNEYAHLHTGTNSK